MNFKILDLVDVSFSDVLSFYGMCAGDNANWVKIKLIACHNAGVLLGKVCVDEATGGIAGAYLGIIQPLLSNSAIKAVQSIDTLVAPKVRGGNVLRLMTREFYASLRALGYDCVYGLPNNKIALYRYKVLGWNKSRDTFCYFIPIPLVLFKAIYLMMMFFGFKLPNYMAKDKDCRLLSDLVKDKCGVGVVCDSGVVSSSYVKGLFQKVGALRVGRHLNIYEKFVALCVVSVRSTGFFFITYATKDSDTAAIFSPFSFKKKALDFSGINLAEGPKYSFGEQSFEFVEYDTYGYI